MDDREKGDAATVALPKEHRTTPRHYPSRHTNSRTLSRRDVRNRAARRQNPQSIVASGNDNVRAYLIQLPEEQRYFVGGIGTGEQHFPCRQSLLFRFSVGVKKAPHLVVRWLTGGDVSHEAFVGRNARFTKHPPEFLSGRADERLARRGFFSPPAFAYNGDACAAGAGSAVPEVCDGSSSSSSVCARVSAML